MGMRFSRMIFGRGGRRGEACSSCVGCVALVVVAYLVLSWGGCVPRSVSVPGPDGEAEFSARTSASGQNLEVMVSRKLGKLSLREGERQFICGLGGTGRALLVRHDRRTFLRVDPARRKTLPPDQWSRLQDLERLEGVEEFRRAVPELLGPLPSRSAGYAEVIAGPDWEGQETLQVTYGRRRPGRHGGAGAMIPGPWVYESIGYVPNLGIVLNRVSRDSKPGGTDFDLFGGAAWGSLEVGALDASVFEAPAGYKELWSDEELAATTPVTPFTRDPLPGYTAIGGRTVKELTWGQERVTCVRETWMQDPRPEGRWHCELFVYSLKRPEDVEGFLEHPDIAWLGFEGWDSTALAPQATARISPGRLLLRKNASLVRMELSWFKPNQPGQHAAPDDPRTTEELTALARRLSEGLP